MITAHEVLLCFEVPGRPRGKGRPRLTRSGRAYTPAETRKYEAAIQAAARDAMGATMPHTGALVLEVNAYHSRPAKPAKGHPCRGMGPAPAPLSMGGSRYPDADNVLKAAADALNGVAYRDDAQLWAVTCRRWWCAVGDAPRLVVTLLRA